MNNDITQHITLELSREVSKSSLSVKKNDTNSRRVQVVLTNNGGMMKLDQVVMAIVKGTKPDGTKFWNDCTINGDTIYFMITSQMLNVVGDVECEIEVTWLDESRITTPTFKIHVYESTQTGVESQNEYNGIIQALAETINNRTMAQKAAADAAKSASESSISAEASLSSANDSAKSAELSESYKNITREYRDYITNYINAFIQSIEDDNPILALAKAYTDQKTSEINGTIGDKADLLTTIKENLVAAINEVNSIAIGRNQALSYTNYQTLVESVNAMQKGELKTGQNMYISTVGVPDLWVYEENEEKSEYIYTTDAALENEIKTNGYVVIGYYKIAMLETQKVDLTDINNAIAAINAAKAYPV